MVTFARPSSDACDSADAASLEARLAAWLGRVNERCASRVTAHALGHVVEVSATLIAARLPRAKVGHLCELDCIDAHGHPMLAEVIGFNDSRTLLAPLAATQGLAPGMSLRSLGRPHDVEAGTHLLGRLLDGLGRPLDASPPVVPSGRHAPRECVRRPVLANPPAPLARPRIVDALTTGIRALDGALTLGRGQRIGLFAGPGCGKTTLIGALARGIDADAVVLGLVGERGREVNEFLERELDSAVSARTVVVCATSERPAMERVRAAFTATAIAEGLSANGAHVLLLVDSLTRVARAQREIGIAAGEPTGHAGLPPSVYAMLPRLTERAGPLPRGSITAVYTVLTETSTLDPIAEEARSLLDGHIVLSTELAQRGHFPAIDILASTSRAMDAIVAESHRNDAARLRCLLSRHRDLQLLLTLGEYQAGRDTENDDAVARHPRLLAFLRQDTRTPCPWRDTLEQLHAVVAN
jgi:ATP synthase in type III secretion protein N